MMSSANAARGGPGTNNKLKETGMKFFSTPTIGLGGLALAASLAMFSSSASAVEIPACVVASDACGGDVSGFAVDGSGGGWDFEFPTGEFFTAPAGQLSLTFEMFSFGLQYAMSGVFLTDLNGDEITTGLTLDVENFTFDAGSDTQIFTASWTLASALQIHDFHLPCADVETGACASTFALSYNFELAAEGDGNTVPAPSAAPLLLLGLAVTGLGALVRRRRSALEPTTA